MDTRLVLASASPRRRELLAAAGLSFEVVAPAVDESLRAGTLPEVGARALAERKARAVAHKLAGRDVWVLAADTIVALELEDTTRLLGKPENEFQARQMLRWLSGSRHGVVTGVCAWRVRDGKHLTDHERTFVRMREITPAEVDAYVASGEWRDKAGGYAIQENADRFVTGLEEGGFDNVVGLPVRRAVKLLRTLGAPCGSAAP